MSLANNPYEHSLDGLEIADPIETFFKFCRERELIRQKRERGEPAPWSKDPIFQRARFLNVFREDDKVTKSILRFVKDALQQNQGSSLYVLVRSIFFARWCNRHLTLDAIKSRWATEFVKKTGEEQNTKLLSFLDSFQPSPWSNVTAYPVEPVAWDGARYSRIRAAAQLFARKDVINFIADSFVTSGGNVTRATELINAKFKMENDFPIFMAVMDVAWFRPDLIDPNSNVPVGIGAVPFLRRLEKHPDFADCKDHDAIFQRIIALQPSHWPEARRGLAPIDCEYLCCECRKYLSYKNGTKTFSGKNVFTPGKSAMLGFDTDFSGSKRGNSLSKIVVIAGAPCSGKSTLIARLRELGYMCHGETAETLIKEGVANGQTVEEIRMDNVAWQTSLLEKDLSLFRDLLEKEDEDVDNKQRGVVFTDTSFIETVVFSRRTGIQIGPNISQWLREEWSKRVIVFFLSPLPKSVYEQTQVRVESNLVSQMISDEVQSAYLEFGLNMVHVPPVTVEQRLGIVLEKLETHIRGRVSHVSKL